MKTSWTRIPIFWKKLLSSGKNAITKSFVTAWPHSGLGRWGLATLANVCGQFFGDGPDSHTACYASSPSVTQHASESTHKSSEMSCVANTWNPSGMTRLVSTGMPALPRRIPRQLRLLCRDSGRFLCIVGGDLQSRCRQLHLVRPALSGRARM
jgi:hypothetical protein